MAQEMRVWNASMGLGTLTQNGRDLRVVYDSGSVYTQRMSGLHIGTPAAYALMQKNPKRAQFGRLGQGFREHEWLWWDTYIGESGDVLVVRRDCAPPEGTPKPEDTVLLPKGARRPKAPKHEAPRV